VPEPQRITDKAILRRHFIEDVGLYGYALGDLVDPMWAISTFTGIQRDDNLTAVSLLWTGVNPPVVLAFGDINDAASLFERIPSQEVFYMLPEDLLSPFQQFFQTDNVIHLWRMTVEKRAFTPPPQAAQVRRLKGDDAEALRTLYAKGMGGPRPEEVAAMTPHSIEEKLLFAVEETGELVAVAGTHIFAPEEKVGVVGYVYTAPEHRGKGYAKQATAAVTRSLFDGGVEQVLLNVAKSNLPAIRVYEQLGFKRHCPIVEGPALKRVREI
jgi:RimJ/RimL family protein N-acetyltransferase